MERILTGKESVGAIIVAAGQSSRMDGIDKIMHPLLDRPLLAWTLAPFVRSPLVNSVITVLRKDMLAAGDKLIQQEGWSSKIILCEGGARRQDSVAAGLALMEPSDWVLVHDGDRPCVNTGLIEEALRAAYDTGAAIPGTPISDTIKRVNTEGLVQATIPRDGLWTVQTPQAFRYTTLRSAYESLTDDVTDDASLVERMGWKVRVFPAPLENIKVTRPSDLMLAEAILRFRERYLK